MHSREEKLEAFARLPHGMGTRRERCPWDRKQTNESLRPNTIEETYELADALIKGDKSDICKELGDVLLHIVFYARIGSETGDFDIADVCDKLCDKLIYRHPHVYGPEAERIERGEITVDEVLRNWEQLKVKEKDGNRRVLSGVPEALPSLIKAYRKELGELEAELRRGDKAKSTQELGDFLFSVINAARLYKLNPDNALELTNRKFIRRFTYLEEHSIRAGRPLTEMTLAEMDAIWNEAKALEHDTSNDEGTN